MGTSELIYLSHMLLFTALIAVTDRRYMTLLHNALMKSIKMEAERYMHLATLLQRPSAWLFTDLRSVKLLFLLAFSKVSKLKVFQYTNDNTKHRHPQIPSDALQQHQKQNRQQ